jgi:SAM-dependent methyltransferase
MPKLVSKREPVQGKQKANGRLWRMAIQSIPPRIRWAVDHMNVQPGDHILEIGCGAGAGAELICSRLVNGKLFAIDRSESGVDRTKRRCAKFIETGRLTVRQIDLATLRVPVKRLHKVFAFNVNLFWVRECEDEIDLLYQRLLPGGQVYFFYETLQRELVPNIVGKASAALVKAGFRVSVVEQKAPPVIGLVGRK